MIRSLRGRLLAWYAFVLLTAIGGFAGILYSLTRAARFEQVDTRLVSAAEYLDAVLRSLPRGVLEAGGEPAGSSRRDRPGGRPGPPNMKGKAGRPPEFDRDGPPFDGPPPFEPGQPQRSSDR